MKIDRPITPSHIRHKKKAELNKQKELEEIARRNRILYNKMAYMKPSKLKVQLYLLFRPVSPREYK